MPEKDTPKAIPRFLIVAVKLDAILIFDMGRDLIISVLLGLWKKTPPMPIDAKASSSNLGSRPALPARYPKSIIEIAIINIPRAARYLNWRLS